MTGACRAITPHASRRTPQYRRSGDARCHDVPASHDRLGMSNGPGNLTPNAPLQYAGPTTATARTLPLPDHRDSGRDVPFHARPLLERTGLQLAHRCGAAAMLLFLGGVAAAVKQREYRPLLLATFVLADVALAGAVVAWRSARSGGRTAREALWAGAFGLVWLAPSAVWLAIRSLTEE